MKNKRIFELNQKNIIDAAKKQFAEKGTRFTTVDDIAREAQCSKSTLYVYFKSKDEIYNHIIFEYMTLLQDKVKSALQHREDIAACYHSLCQAILELYQAHPLYFESVLSKISVDENDFKDQNILYDIYIVGEQINELLKEVLEFWQEKQWIRLHSPPLHASFALWAGICGVISLADHKEQYLLKGMNTSKHEFLESSFAFFFEALHPSQPL